MERLHKGSDKPCTVRGTLRFTWQTKLAVSPTLASVLWGLKMISAHSVDWQAWGGYDEQGKGQSCHGNLLNVYWTLIVQQGLLLTLPWLLHILHFSRLYLKLHHQRLVSSIFSFPHSFVICSVCLSRMLRYTESSLTNQRTNLSLKGITLYCRQNIGFYAKE